MFNAVSAGAFEPGEIRRSSRPNFMLIATGEELDPDQQHSEEVLFDTHNSDFRNGLSKC
jgi:hypothetical protein